MHLIHWGQDEMADSFKCIFLDENARISIKISLMFVLKGAINNIPALVQIMAWHQPDNKPLFEPKMVRLLKHVCVTRPQWVNSLATRSSDCHFENMICGHCSCWCPEAPILLTWTNFSPSTNKWLHALKIWDEIMYKFPNFNNSVVEVWEWIGYFTS